MMKLYKLFFMFIMLMSTLMSISSLSWFTAWMGLEVNMMSLIPLMKNIKNKYSSEAIMKYFMIQTMASMLFMFSVLMYSSIKNMSINYIYISSLMLNSTLLMKMGAAPFHFWLPEVFSGLNWKSNLILMTWQKIAPMSLLTLTTLLPMFLSIFIVFSSLISGITGMNQMCLRKLMAYSSINHISWMISAILSSVTTWMIYMMIYSIMNLNIIMILNKFNIYSLNQLSKLLNFNKKIKLMFMMNFLSLGGLPPFIGFLPKWLTMNFLINNYFYTLATLLVILTLISLYIYIRMNFSTTTLMSSESLTKTFKHMNYMYFLFNIMTLMSLLLCFILINMY